MYSIKQLYIQVLQYFFFPLGVFLGTRFSLVNDGCSVVIMFVCCVDVSDKN